MSFIVRDANSTFGAGAAVELPNGAGASTIANLQVFESVNFYAATATQLPAATTYTLWVAPPGPSTATSLPNLGSQNRVVGVSYYYTTAATGAATFSLEICAPGIANGSGTAVVTNASLQTVASTTPFNAVLNTNIDNLQFSPASRLNIITGATATTALVNFCLILYIIRTA